MTPELRRCLGAKRAEKKHLITNQLRMKGYTGASLGKEIGVSRQVVFATLSGFGHSPKVLDALRTLGITEAYLFDPRTAEVA